MPSECDWINSDVEMPAKRELVLGLLSGKGDRWLEVVWVGDAGQWVYREKRFTSVAKPTRATFKVTHWLPIPTLPAKAPTAKKSR